MSYSTYFKVSVIVTGIAIVVLVPVELIHSLIWIVKHIYLLLEHLLSFLVIQIFETSRRTTDYIVAYTMIILSTFFFIKMCLAVKSLSQKLFENLPAWREQKTAEIRNGWRQLPKTQQVKWLLSMSAGMTLVAATSF